MSKTQYCYSLDEEQYHGKFDTLDEALGAATEAASDEHGPGTHVAYIGEVESAMEILRRASYLHEHILEHLENHLADQIAADDLIIQLPSEHRAGLATAVLDYLEMHASFTRYSVINSRERDVVVDE